MDFARLRLLVDAADDGNASAAEDVRAERIERRLHDDPHRAVERRAPEIGGVLKRNRPLRAAGLPVGRFGAERDASSVTTQVSAGGWEFTK